MRRIHITGAAGRIGTCLTRRLADRYDLVLADISPIADAGGCTVILGDIADMACAQRMVQGVDTVIHLAANPNQFAR
jgi:uronate dehydrogenase